MAVLERLVGRLHELSVGFSVRRTLPQRSRRRLGPFVFWDEMGAATLSPGQALDVRPHPHIGLATLTYLFDGAIEHRDSLGHVSRIVPGHVNLMTSGRGIVHSERTPGDLRATVHRLHGIQAWLALPRALEEGEPGFHHCPVEALPTFDEGRVRGRVVAGDAYGLRAPVPVAMPTLYVDAHLDPGAELELPTGHDERGVYVVSGEVAVAGETFGAGELAVLDPDERSASAGPQGAHVLLLGGAELDGDRLMFWNFVGSRRDLIDAAKRDWWQASATGFEQGRFRLPPGEQEHIPLPGEPPPGPPACTEEQPTT